MRKEVKRKIPVEKTAGAEPAKEIPVGPKKPEGPEGAPTPTPEAEVPTPTPEVPGKPEERTPKPEGPPEVPGPSIEVETPAESTTRELEKGEPAEDKSVKPAIPKIKPDTPQNAAELEEEVRGKT